MLPDLGEKFISSGFDKQKTIIIAPIQIISVTRDAEQEANVSFIVEIDDGRYMASAVVDLSFLPKDMIASHMKIVAEEISNCDTFEGSISKEDATEGRGGESYTFFRGSFTKTN